MTGKPKSREVGTRGSSTNASRRSGTSKSTASAKNADPFGDQIEWDYDVHTSYRGERITEHYVYRDEDNEPLFIVGRTPDKQFPQWQPDGTLSLKGVRRVLYRLPEVIDGIRAGATIHVGEGEKDVHAVTDAADAEGLNVVATCVPGGASANSKALDALDVLGRYGGADEVVVWQDKDGPGRKLARKVVERVARMGLPVRLVEAAEGKDAADHLAAGYSLDEAEELDLPEIDPNEGHSGRERLDVVLNVLDQVTGGDDDQYEAVCPAHNDRKASLSVGLGDDRYPVITCHAGCTDEEGWLEFRSILLDRGVPDWALRSGRAPDLSTFPYTDVGNAERLVLLHGDVLRYVHAWKSWLVWDGRRWRRDATAKVERRAKVTVRETFSAAADLPSKDDRDKLLMFARRSESKHRLRAMIDLAQSEEGIPVEPADLDADPWRLTVLNGTLDLRTGRLRGHDPMDLITKLAPVDFDPAADCPAWRQFLVDVLPDPDDRSFVQRAVGYSLTADVSEHVLFVMYGTGRNGKSTFLEVLRTVLGNYSQQAPSDLLLARNYGSGGASEDMARLHGARFVATSETEEGRRLAESVVKQLTGGDTVVARFLYGNLFEFKPTHKLWLATNHLPQVRGTDEAIWSRLRQVPFTVMIPPEHRDPHLKDKLLDEAPGILRWAVEGCVAWQSEGLGESANVVRATEEYREESDVFGQFLADRCLIGPGYEATTDALRAAHAEWAEANGLKPMSRVALGRKLGERPEGFVGGKLDGGNARGWRGIAVRTTPVKSSVRTRRGLRVVAGGDEEES